MALTTAAASILILLFTVSFPAPAAAARTLASTIGAWQQCGGQSACGSHCVDGVWPGASCPSMYQCYRQSQWYWQCSTTPFGPSMMPSMMPTPAPKTPGHPTPTPVPVAPAAPTPSDLTPYQASRVAVSTPVTFSTQYSYGNAQLAQIPLRFDPIDNNLIRTGYYYLPSQWQSKALPVMVLFHGLEGYGLDTIQAGSGGNFQAMAEHYQHIIVAPDSEFATTRGWVIPNANQAPSLDMLHTLACLDYVRALPGVRFRTGKIVATGVSAGGLMSIPMASRYKVFTHAMLLHSRSVLAQMGSIGRPIWMSSGVYDVDVTPSYVQTLAAQIKQAHPSWPAVVYNVRYRIPHDLSDPYERIDAIHWWLNLGGYTTIATSAQLAAVRNGGTIMG